MSSKRIHWAFDGTVASFWTYNYTIYGVLTSGNRYTLDADASHTDLVDCETDDKWGVVLNFPDTILLDKFTVRGYPGNPHQAQNLPILVDVSSNSTNGIDGTWSTVYAGTISYTAENIVSITPVSCKWFRIRSTDTYYGYTGMQLRQLNIFGEYQTPRFEFWDTTETTKFTANYPLDMADAPNYADYNGSISFKLKNVDSSTHSYNLNLNSIKWNDSIDKVKDATIDNYFQITKAGLPTDVSDTFTASNGTDADKVKWTTIKAGNALDIQSNKLHFNMSVAGTYAYTKSKFRLPINFDVQIDFSDFTSTANNGNGLVFTIIDITGLYYAYIKVSYNTGNKFEFRYANGGAETYTTIARTNNYGKMRLVRSGSSISFYYQDGGGAMTLYQTIVLFSADVFVQSGSYLAGGTLTGDVDNFLVNTLSPPTVIEWDTILMDGILTGAFTPTITVSAAVLAADNPADGYHQFAVDVTEYA